MQEIHNISFQGSPEFVKDFRALSLELEKQIRLGKLAQKQQDVDGLMESVAKQEGVEAQLDDLIQDLAVTLIKLEGKTYRQYAGTSVTAGGRMVVMSFYKKEDGEGWKEGEK